MESLSGNNRSKKEMEKHNPGSSRPDTKFRRKKLLQRKQLIQWRCPPKLSMRDGLFIAAGDLSMELEVQKNREKGVAEQVSILYPNSIPPNPSVELDLEDDQSQDDRCTVPLKPIEELEEGEVLSPCKICGSSQPVPKESTSIHRNPRIIPANTTGLQIDPALIAAIATFVRTAQNDLIDPDLLTMFLSNPQLVEQEMNRLATSLATEKMPKPNMPAGCNALSQAQQSSTMPISKKGSTSEEHSV